LRAGQPVVLAVDRNGREMTIVATPSLTAVDTPAGRTQVGRLGRRSARRSPVLPPPTRLGAGKGRAVGACRDQPHRR
jgi:hypothetical protein